MASLLKRIEDNGRAHDAIQPRHKMMQGDHWLGGKGWKGPQPSGKDAHRVMDLIKNEFVFKNLLAEICRRHRNSLVGKEPIWSLGPKRPLMPGEETTSEETALIKEGEAALTTWFDDLRVHLAVQDAVMTSLWAVVGVSGVGYLRLYLPVGMLEGEGFERIVPDVDLEEAMSYVHVHSLDPLVGGIVKDGDGLPLAGYYNYKGEDEVRYLEINALAKTLDADGLLRTPQNYEDDDTVVQLRNLDSNQVVAEAGYKLGGRLLTIEIRRSEALISEAIVSQQMLYNMAYTMMGRNVVQGGFLERTVTNAQLPGRWVDEAGNPSADGTKFEPDPVHVGPGSLNFLSGLPVRNEMGEITNYTTPAVTYKDPVPVTTFVETMEQTKRGIYEEAQQLYVLISGDASSSGQSRIQATNDFVASLGETAIPVEGAFRKLLETALAWGSYFAEMPLRFESLRADVEANISAVQASPDEIRVNLEQYNAGTLSRETTMSRNGVEDVAAEQQRIETELAAELEARAVRIEAGLEPGALTEGDEAQADQAEKERQRQGVPATA